MKQFNLEEYLANPSRKVVTREGRDVRIICTDFDNPNFPVIGEVKGSKWPYSFTKKGMYNRYDECDADLFFAPEKHKGWVNIYRDLKIDELYCRYIFPSEEEAKRNTTSDVIATVNIEWET